MKPVVVSTEKIEAGEKEGALWLKLGCNREYRLPDYATVSALICLLANEAEMLWPDSAPDEGMEGE